MNKLWMRMAASVLALALMMAGCSVAEPMAEPSAPVIEVHAENETQIETQTETQIEPQNETIAETEAPAEPSIDPSIEPSTDPSAEPSTEPTPEPSIEPSMESSIEPSMEASAETSIEPSIEPSVEPSVEPTAEPVQFYYTVANGECTITRLWGDAPEEVVIPSEIEGVPVTAIGEQAFIQKYDIKRVIVPDSVRRIGDEAFSGCSNLVSVRLPEKVELGQGLFIQCRNLKNVNLPSGMTSIPKKLFSECNTMPDFTLPSGIRAIEESGFDNCKEFVQLDLPEGIESIGSHAFRRAYRLKKISLPDSLSYIAADAFEECDLLTAYVKGGSYAQRYCEENNIHYILTGEGDSAFDIVDGALRGYHGSANDVVVPEGVTRIADGAFKGDKRIASVVLPEGIREIGKEAFQDCTGLKTIHLPSSLRTIGEHAFMRCSALNGLELNEGLETIGNNAFTYCTDLESITLPASVKELGFYVFSYCSSLSSANVKSTAGLNMYCFKECSSLKEVSLPEGLKYISDFVFYGCKSLEYIDIPSSVTRFGSYVFDCCTSLKEIELPDNIAATNYGLFDNCTSLERVVLPKNIKDLDIAAFKNCKSLTSLVIPDGAYFIGSNCFEGCTSLKELYIPDSVEIIHENAFYDCPNLVVYASAGSVASRYCRENDIEINRGGAGIESMKFRESSITIGVGEKYMPFVEINPAYTSEDLRFSASSSGISVDEMTGKITGNKEGTAYIYATSESGLQAKCKVVVKKAPSKVSIKPGKLTMYVGDTYQLSYSLPSGSAGSAVFYCQDYFIADVTEDGFVTAIEPGEAIVQLNTYNKKYAESRITVLEPPRIALNLSELSLGVGDSYTLIPSTTDGSALGSIGFKSEKSSIAAISQDGVITAKKAGTTRVAVVDTDGSMVICKVTVKKAPSSIMLSPASGSLSVGEQAQFKWKLSSNSAASLIFESSNPDVLEVFEDGSAIAKAPGTATVRVATHNGKRATSVITVYCAPESIAFADQDMRLAVGMKGTLEAVLSEGSRGSYSFASSDAAVIEVDAATGRFIARKQGSATLSVTAYNGVTASQEVRVYAAPVSMKLVEKKLSLGVGEQYRLRVDCMASGNQECAPGLTFKSSNTKVAAVDANGVVTARKAGSATITVKSFNGLSAKCSISVRKAPTAIALPDDELTLAVNESISMAARLAPSGCGGVVKYEVSDTSLAFVDEKGNLIANRDSGSVVLTASTYNGLSASCTVNLCPEPKDIAFLYDSYALNVGMKAEPPYLLDGDCATIYLSSSNPAVAYIDGEGRIVAKKKGSAYIRVETYNGLHAEMLLTVLSAPNSYKFSLPGVLEAETGYMVNGYLSASPEVNPEYAIKSVKSSNGSVVAVQEVYGVYYLLTRNTGTAKITLTTYNGKTLSKTVRVVQRQIDSRENTAATLDDYLGAWALASVEYRGISLDPAEAGVDPWQLLVRAGGASITIGDETEDMQCSMRQHTLIVGDDSEWFRFILHKDGRLALELIDGMYMYFTK